MESTLRDVYVPIVLAVMIAEARPLTVDNIIDGVMNLLESLRNEMDFENAICGDQPAQDNHQR